jgi:hypothetical protein
MVGLARLPEAAQRVRQHLDTHFGQPLHSWDIADATGLQQYDVGQAAGYMRDHFTDLAPFVSGRFGYMFTHDADLYLPYSLQRMRTVETIVRRYYNGFIGPVRRDNPDLDVYRFVDLYTRHFLESAGELLTTLHR